MSLQRAMHGALVRACYALDLDRAASWAGIELVARGESSPVPTRDEIEGSFEYRLGEPPYLDSTVFDDATMPEFFESFREYAQEFDPPRTGDSSRPAGFFWENEYFSHTDALAYYCILRHTKPRRVIEIGSGFSTLVALQALERNGRGELRCIEPYPRPYLRESEGITELVPRHVQDLPEDYFVGELEVGDVLFIDSSHSVKIGSDCLYLYLRVVPALRPGVLIHAHDIFLPDGFPAEWAREHRMYWTEQYLLHALLLGNRELRVRFGSHYFHRLHRGLLEEWMEGKAAAGGSSFWFQRRPG